jgi:hypothetical protein
MVNFWFTVAVTGRLLNRILFKLNGLAGGRANHKPLREI